MTTDIKETKGYKKGIKETKEYKKGWNDALKIAHDIALVIDSKKGNEKEIAKAINERKVKI